MTRIRRLVWLLAAVGLIAGCNVADARPARLLLWHTWSGEQATTLNAMIAAYRDLNPDFEVITVAVPEAEIVSRLADRSESGLGPDLILADSAIVYQMAERGLIRDLGPLELDLSDYLSTAVRMLSDGTRLFGLPLSTHTHVLYYDRQQVDTPPETLADLMQRIEGGDVLAQNPSFNSSYWGVGAFGGAFADPERRLLFGQGGFVNWLNFLSSARTQPGFLLNDSTRELRQAFVDGEATYYVADSDQLVNLLAAVGPERLGVAMLPTGPNGGAPRPFLELDAIAFSKVSNDDEFARALDFAQFLGGANNQLALATTEVGLVPVNTQVRLLPSLPASTLTVARQARSAETISFVNRPIWNELSAGALDLFDNYRRVSQGVLDPEDFVDRAFSGFEEVYGLSPPVSDPQSLCPVQPGAVTMWHALDHDKARILEDLVQEFETICTGVTVEIEQVPADEVIVRFTDEARAGGGPDLVLGSSAWLALFAEEGLLLDQTERFSAESLQQFIPRTVDAMRYRDRLYGVPESEVVLALYYNRAAVSDPPIDIQQLVLSANAHARLAMPVGFYWGWWGMDPFGGFEFDSLSGTIGETQGLVAWLDALQAIDAEQGVDLYFDYAEAEDAFVFEEAAYFIGGPWSLPRLRQGLGEERFRVVPLPNGPLKPGSPVLRVQGTMINANANDLSVEIALAFQQFLNLPASQQRLLETGNHVSANVTVNLADYPNIASFSEQAKVATPVVENQNFGILIEQGDDLYHSVLSDGVEPTDAVPEFVDAVHTLTGAQQEE